MSKPNIQLEHNIPYESLTPFPEDTKFMETMRELIKAITETPENEWEKHVSAINTLRRLRKYQSKFFDEIISEPEIQSRLVKFISSLRSSVTIPTLLLIKELFSEYQFEYNDKENNEPIELTQFVKMLLPELISKSLSEKSFIREGAKNCLNECCKNMLYEETILTLLKECCNEKNVKTVEVAYNTLMDLIANFEKNYLVYYAHWKVIFSYLAQMWNIKKDSYIKRPGKIYLQFGKVVTPEMFDKIFKDHCSNEKDIESIKAALEYIKDGNSTNNNQKEKMNLKEMIKQSKERNENNNYTNDNFELVLTKEAVNKE